MKKEFDYLLNGRVCLRQDNAAFRASTDAVFLALSAPAFGRVLDVGAGLGAVALCYAEKHKSAHIEALEIQSDLHNLLCENIILNGQEGRVIGHCGNLFASGLASESFDLLLSNPPFAPDGSPASSSVSRSVAVSERGWSIADWLESCCKLLRRKGWLGLIHRSDRFYEILQGLAGKVDRLYIYPLFAKSGSAAHRFIFYARKKSSRSSVRLGGLALPSVNFLEGMVVHGDDGSYSAHAESVLRGALPIIVVSELGEYYV